MTSLGRGRSGSADAADALSSRRGRRGSRASLASTDSGDEGAGHRPPRKRTRRLSPPQPQPAAAAMHQPPQPNGAPPLHLNGDAARNGELPSGLRMTQTDQEIVRLIGQHLLSVGLE